MSESVSAAQWRAVAVFQKRRDRYASNPFWFEVYDHAIDVVLNPTRIDDPFLVRNALRDAKRTIKRRKARDRLRGLWSIDDIGGPEGPPLQLPLEAADPESTMIWADGYAVLAREVGGRHSRAVACLSAWRLGESVSETGQRLGISPNYVTKLRAAIRSTANEMLTELRAA
jgi:hypothetical protein